MSRVLAPRKVESFALWDLVRPLRGGVALLATLLLAASATAADWPQWRGPERTGISKETGLLKQWPEKGLTPVWMYRAAGLGFSSFAIVDGKLYTLGTRGDDEIIIALDIKSGKEPKELWTAKLGPIFTFKSNQWGDGPRGTPTIDGGHLYALGGQGELVCVDLAGKEVWRKNLIKDFGGEMMSEWGYSESPLIDGDTLICTPGGEQGTLAALQKTTGSLLWRSKEQKHKAPYSSAIKAVIHNIPQYLQTSYVDDVQGGFISGFAPKDGKVLWSALVVKDHSYAISPTPIVKGNVVYCTSGSGAGCHAFALSPDLKPEELFSTKNQKALKNNHGGVVLVGDHIYGHSEGGAWVCQELKKPGNVAWKENEDLNCGSGSITAAEGMLYLLTDDGTIALVEASPKEWNKISSFELPEKSKIPQTRSTSRSSGIWTHPVIANGHLFVRDHEFIFCFDIRAK